MLSGVEEEKDPRNLLITYDLLYFILKLYSPEDPLSLEVLKPFADEIFDKISCYFPINFVPPKNDKHLITPQTLKQKLARCFLASPLLANSAIPFILDKLTATQVETKKECLGLLQQFFGPEGYQDWAILEHHVEPAASLLLGEYFNQPDESC